MLIYNGNLTVDYGVPGCKMSLCSEKATQDCSRCGDPICNGHMSMVRPWENVCQSCRLDEWKRKNDPKP